MMRMLVGGIVLAATVIPATADVARFAAAVEQYTQDDHRAWVIDRLMKFNLGAKCWAKVVAPRSGAVSAASYVVSDVVEYAKAIGAGDWAAMEQDKRALAAAMTAFRERFFLTVSVDGDDCDSDSDTPWIRAWRTTTEALKEFPVPGGKVFVTLDISPKYQDVSVEVGRDGATVKIRAPKDHAPKSATRIEETFEKLHEGVPTTTGGLDAFVFAATDASPEDYRSQILTKLHTFRLGKKCLAKIADPDQSAVYWAGWAISAVADWAKRTGSGDWPSTHRHTPDRARIHAAVAADIAALRKRFSVTVVVDGDDCDTSIESAWLVYWKTTLKMLAALPPRSTTVAITITASSKAKGLSIAVGKHGSSYAVTGPKQRAPRDYADRIEAAFMTVAKDRSMVSARKQNTADSKVAKAGGNPFPHHGKPLRDATLRAIPSHERRAYAKGATVSMQMSSNPHTLVYRCVAATCTDSPGASRQWRSAGWANAD